MGEGQYPSQFTTSTALQSLCFLRSRGWGKADDDKDDVEQEAVLWFKISIPLGWLSNLVKTVCSAVKPCSQADTGPTERSPQGLAWTLPRRGVAATCSLHFLPYALPRGQREPLQGIYKPSLFLRLVHL